MQLTQAQFEAKQDQIDNLVRGTKSGTPERASANAVSDRWEAVLALPQRTAADRETRFAAIAAFEVAS